MPEPFFPPMPNDKLKRQIALETARLLLAGAEIECFRARLRAARSVCQGWVRPADLPTNREIRELVQSFLRRPGEGEAAQAVRGQRRARAADRTPQTLADHAELARLLTQRPPTDANPPLDRFDVYHALLSPLEVVRQPADRHPEGDALYHSLQVFDLARDAQPYDEELQLAALLHDVGKAIDADNHVAAGLAALDGYITPRTAWLIEHRGVARSLAERALGLRARRRLESSDDFETLQLLCDCDRRGRQSGVVVPELEEALDSIRALAEFTGDEP